MSRLKKGIISFFILFNFLIMLRVHMPQDNKAVRSVYQQVDKYLTFFSIYQDWMMFAPDPGKFNNYITAEIEFFDGTNDVYNFPRNTELNIRQKYSYGEKYRKIFSEGFHEDDMSFLWEDTAKFALRKMKGISYSKIPKTVRLTRYWDQVPDVKKSFRKHLSRQTAFQKQTFYTYEVIK